MPPCKTRRHLHFRTIHDSTIHYSRVYFGQLMTVEYSSTFAGSVHPRIFDKDHIQFFVVRNIPVKSLKVGDHVFLRSLVQEL